MKLLWNLEFDTSFSTIDINSCKQGCNNYNIQIMESYSLKRFLQSHLSESCFIKKK